jgi:hypothetical protein
MEVYPRFDPNVTPAEFILSPYQIIREYVYVGIDSVIYQVIFSFTLGLFFAPWSIGLFVIVFFLLLFELTYGLIVQIFTWEQLVIRITIVSAYFLGWLLGRIVIGDTKPIRMFFEDGFQKMGKPGHCHPYLKRRNRRAPIATRILMGNDLKEQNGYRYVSKPQIVDYATDHPDPMDYAESQFNYVAPEYKLEPEPSIPRMKSDLANELLMDIMMACHAE